MATHPINKAKHPPLYREQVTYYSCYLRLVCLFNSCTYYCCCKCCNQPTQFEREATLFLISQESQNTAITRTSAIAKNHLSPQDRKRKLSNIHSLSEFLTHHPQQGLWVYNVLKENASEENIDFVFSLSYFLSPPFFDLVTTKMPRVFSAIGDNLAALLKKHNVSSKYLIQYRANWQLSDKKAFASLILNGFSKNYNYPLFFLFFNSTSDHQLNLSHDMIPLYSSAQKAATPKAMILNPSCV